jgi:hypothetical protein
MQVLGAVPALHLYALLELVVRLEVQRHLIVRHTKVHSRGNLRCEIKNQALAVCSCLSPALISLTGSRVSVRTISVRISSRAAQAQMLLVCTFCKLMYLNM